MRRVSDIAVMHEEAAARLYNEVRAAIETAPAANIRTARRISIAILLACAITALVIVGASQIVYAEWAAGVSVAVLSRSSIVTAGAIVIALAAISTLAAMWRGREGFGPPVSTLVAIALLVTPMYAVATTLFAQHALSSEVVVSPWGARCLLIATVVGATVLATFGWALHRAVPEATTGRAAVLGACAGAWAGVAVFFFCPSADHQHLLLGHVLPIAAFTMIGALMLPRVLRP